MDVRMFARAAAIVVFSSAVGLTHNAVSDNGIPLLTPPVSRPEAAIQWSLHLEGIRTTLADAKQAFDNGAVFVDARPLEEYLAGRVPGARHLEVYGFADRFKRVLGDVSRDTRIIAYCGGGSCKSSTKLAQLLVEAGYSNVGCFFLGWQAWSDAGYRVVSGPAGEE